MLNKVILIGRLGEKPEVRAVGSNNKVANCNVATWDNYYDKDRREWKQLTEWHQVKVWGSDAAERAGKLEKGDMVVVEGAIKTHSYGEGSDKKYVTEIVGSIRRIGKRNAATGDSVEEDMPY